MGLALIVGLICGLICVAIASSKGRNAVGWFFVGFLVGVIGLIICACMSNLNEEKARFAKIEQDRRRLREQLRQEQLKGEAFRLHAAQRLDAHDRSLGVDTRQTTGLLGGPTEQPKFLPGSPEEALALSQPGTTLADPGAAPIADPTSAAPPAESPIWFYENAGKTFGPIPGSQILAMIRQGAIKNHTLLWRQGFDDWAPAHQVAEFNWAVQA
jgi:uncharacterized membrane protein YeaQ/YmgE (transglycosylase-associated protein family)